MKLLFIAVIFAVGLVAGQYLMGLFDITGYVSALTGTIQGLIIPDSASSAATSCGRNADCETGSYCNLPSSCGGEGVCETKPEVCPAIWNPVCGCDGTTYDNACMAASQGVSVASEEFCS